MSLVMGVVVGGLVARFVLQAYVGFAVTNGLALGIGIEAERGTKIVCERRLAWR